MTPATKTISQQRRLREYQKIRRLYEKIKAENPSRGPYSVYAQIARAFCRSTSGIKFIIEQTKP